MLEYIDEIEWQKYQKNYFCCNLHHAKMSVMLWSDGPKPAIKLQALREMLVKLTPGN